MAVRRKNIRDPRAYIREFLARKQPNPIAESLREGQFQHQVVQSSKIYNRKQYKQEKTNDQD